MYIQSLAGTELLIAIKINRNLQIWSF